MRGAATIFSLILTFALAGGAWWYSQEMMKKAEKQAEDARKNAERNQKVRSGMEQVQDSSLKPDEQRDHLLRQKMRHYIDCSNTHSRRVMTVYNNYKSWFKSPAHWRRGPNCRGDVRTMLTAFAFQKCYKRLAVAKGFSPSLPELEKAALDWVNSLKALDPLLKQAHRYYDQKDWKDDRCKVARKLHPKLVKAFAAFDKARQDVGAAIDKYNAAMLERDLKRVEAKKGRGTLYYKLKTFLDAKKVYLFYRSQWSLDNPDTPEMRKRLKAYEGTVQGLEGVIARKMPQASKLSYFKVKALSFLKAAKAFVRRKEAKKPWSRSELRQIRGGLGWTVEGSLPQLLRSYNELVDQFNRAKLQR